ncbi:hypothetical protein SLEP1_g13760 [Rubroshorea leprosula]|uniref:Uncharacterized protein n=1 Tax=Rubroshorea leprosula TaxID=152421 RepID=A0AAV5ISD9_9ROSI|nr:hypothetical protein SLEP1_g13760 [Rubroshorea leprosula]
MTTTSYLPQCYVSRTLTKVRFPNKPLMSFQYWC